jgi:DNA-binding MarR family transcriptional regulator
MIIRLIPRDISLTSEAALAQVNRDGPHRISDLAAAAGIAQPSMSELVSRLEADGLVRRGRDPADGRVIRVALTPSGRRFLAQRRRAAADRLAAVVAVLPSDDIVALTAAVTALRHLVASEPIA